MNLVILVGRIGRTPDIKAKEGKTTIANFSVATDEYYNSETHTEWHKCVAFGKTAEFMGAYVSKGALVEIRGRNQTRDWVDKDDNKRQTTEVIIDSLKSLMKGEDKPKSEPSPGDGDDGDPPF
jgi:single-strand DNA-binding protein